MRLGEALRLTIDDVDESQNTLLIQKAKFYKSRIVPLGTGLGGSLLKYINKQRLDDSGGSAKPLFCFHDGRVLSQSAARSAFGRLRLLTGIQREGTGRYQPRLHDLRHTGVVHRVVDWYRNGLDVQYLLPQLATYLGHINLSSTQHYLSLTPELLNEACQRFENYVEGSDHG